MECKQQLWQLVHLLVADHLPNRRLDMFVPVHFLMRPLLHDFGLIAGKCQPSDALALLKRAADDRAVFSGEPSHEG